MVTVPMTTTSNDSRSQTQVYVAGHRGLVGSALMRCLKSRGYNNIITETRDRLDLTNQAKVNEFFESQRPEQVFLAAAKVGGIHANNSFRADFLYENLAIETNVIRAAYKFRTQKLLFLGSSCIYPKHAPQPLREEYLLSGPLEVTNEPYAIAKITGIKLCSAFNSQFGTNFISVMPTNIYGPEDNYDLQDSHVVPALIRKMHAAKTSNEQTVSVWGTGRPRREFLYSEDLADACVYLMENFEAADLGEFVNIGAGWDISIAELAQVIAKIVGFTGEILFDDSKPDGTPQKLLDISRMTKLGWSSKTDLRDGLLKTYDAYKGAQLLTLKTPL